MNLPNALTALRIFLVPWLVVLLLTRTHWGWFLGLVVFTIAVITDYFDGWLARKRSEQTKLARIELTPTTMGILDLSRRFQES